MALEVDFKCELGQFRLQRFPIEKGHTLRAWDAADAYLLADLFPKLNAYAQPKILIINDSFGALSVALSVYKPSVISDSYLSQQAIYKNLTQNNIRADAVNLYDSLHFPQAVFDFVVMKSPKSLAFLEDSVARLARNMTTDTQFILAGMVKHMSTGIGPILEKYIGKTVLSRALKKARLLYVHTEQRQCTQPISPYPYYYLLEGTTYKLCNHANVFSRQRLDIGTRFFLAHLPVSDKPQTVVDLGCGNGIIGVMYALNNPMAKLHFIDESFMAIASAQDNFKRIVGEARTAIFEVTDALSTVAHHSLDLVLCNPPFHQQTTLGTHIAWRMFKQAKRALVKGGVLWVIGNRHLAYQASLKKIFPTVILIAENKKFVLLKAVAN